MDNLAKQTKFHYGWVILVLVCIMPFVAFWAGVPIGLYTLPVSEELGVTRGVYSYGGSWQNIVSMILATQFARINNKLDQRRTVILGGCCYSLGMLLFSFATNMIWVYIARSFIAAGYAFACYTCMALLINNWFAKKTGTFLGIAHMFGNVGSIIMSTVFATWIENAGWRNSMRFTAIGYAIPIILYILFLRSKPSDMGLKPLFFDENASVDTRTLQGENFATGKKSGKFFGMLQDQLTKGNNGLLKRKYITFGVEADSLRTAKAKLDRIETDILNNFKTLGVETEPLSGYERLKCSL